jgi:hypothetical protein
MDIEGLKRVLSDADIEELGIPVILPSLAPHLFAMSQWAVEGPAVRGRQIWFTVGNADSLRTTIPAHVRCRILPVNPEQGSALLKRGPFDALLLPNHGFEYSDPNLILNEFWSARGAYEQQLSSCITEYTLWFWKSIHAPLRLLGLDHHHAVLWDAKQILRPLGVRIDFVWLCDGRPSVNEALPSDMPPFRSSLDIYKRSLREILPSDFTGAIHYDGVISSHSLITAAHLRHLGLPHIHINSTRFGNEWIQDPQKHAELVETVRELFTENRLRIVHNNLGDAMYFRQYFPAVDPQLDLTVPSLCESIHRIRTSVPKQPRFLIWDTRQVLLQNKSPFMKELFLALKQAHGDTVLSQAIMMAESQSYLPEGYLDQFTAIIHVPYNISTMSIFQQTRANIPIWVPDAELLAKLWSNPDEPNEMSWTVFAPGSEAGASPLDHVRDPRVIQAWIQKADFYGNNIGNILTFSSSKDLTERLLDSDYQELMNKAESKQAERRQEIFSAWEQVIRFIKVPPPATDEGLKN